MGGQTIPRLLPILGRLARVELSNEAPSRAVVNFSLGQVHGYRGGGMKQSDAAGGGESTQ